jgi:peptidase M23-like protein
MRGEFGFLALVRLPAIAGLLLMFLGGTASAFDYSGYQPEDLDVLMDRKPPIGNGADVFPVRKIRLEVTLAAPAVPCNVTLPTQTKPDFLKWAMLTSGIPKEWLDRVPVTHCVQVKSAKGKPFWIFIQDALTDSLAKELSPGGKLTLYAMLIYFDQRGPGIVINEFVSPQTQTGQNSAQDCGCGRDFHSGLDLSAPEGTPVQAVADGVVVRVEQNETADVDVPSAGKCGRYVVVKHSFPSGRSVYSRYAQLGRLAGSDGKPLKVGQQVKAKDKVGEVGSQGRFHFEIRPIETAGMDQTPKWTQLYGTDPSMEWSRYAAADPQKFAPDAFGGKNGPDTTKKN